MQPDPQTFLFPDVDLEEWDLDDADDRSELVGMEFPVPGLGRAAAEAVVSQILDGEPAVTWATAQRLLADGLDRDEIVGQLVRTMVVLLREMLDDQEPFDLGEYTARLDALPMPTVDDMCDRIVAAVEASPGITMDDAVATAIGELEPGSALELSIDQVWDRLLVGGPLEVISGERLLSLGSGGTTRTFTHRVTAEEARSGCIHESFDLGALRSEEELLTLDSGGTVEMETGLGVDLHGPADWLDHHEGTLLAFRVDGTSLHVEVVDDAPDLPAGLAERFRAAYDRGQTGHGLPMRASDVIAELLVEDPTTLDAILPPLEEIAAAAGLEVRHGVAGHDDAVWEADARTARTRRAVEDLADADAAVAAIRVLEVADDVAASDRDALRACLDDLSGDAEVLLFVANELFGTDEAAEARGRALAAALVDAATRGSHVAAARWLAAIAAERDGDPVGAEDHLEAGHEADPGDPRVIDRLAWYASDRGDADRALRLWGRLEPTRIIADDIGVLRSATDVGADRAKTPRNAPCWCGSGRKFKQCHLGRPAELDLHARVPWLHRKAVGYLFRRGGPIQSELFDVAMALAHVDEAELDEIDPSRLVEAMTEPLVYDVLLDEGGWLARFVEERGPLLPADEAALAASWVGARRALYEVVEVGGTTASLRPLADGAPDEAVEVEVGRHGSVRRGARVVARVVEGGRGPRIVGPVVGVPGEPDPALAAVVAEGEPLTTAAALGAMSGD